MPGESISVSAFVANNSKITIKSTKAALTETIEYLARNKVVQVEKRELAVIARGKIRAGGSDKWHNESLYVPPLPPTNLRGCHLINIKYDVFVSPSNLSYSPTPAKCERITLFLLSRVQFQFIIEPKSMEKEIKLQLPITLATYPFRNNNADVSNTWPDSVLKPDTHYPSTLPIFRPFDN